MEGLLVVAALQKCTAIMDLQKCADIMDHNAISYLTQTQHRTSDEHEKLGQSRKVGNFNDLQKLITWFQFQSPIDISCKLWTLN